MKIIMPEEMAEKGCLVVVLCQNMRYEEIAKVQIQIHIIYLHMFALKHDMIYILFSEELDFGRGLWTYGLSPRAVPEQLRIVLHGNGHTGRWFMPKPQWTHLKEELE